MKEKLFLIATLVMCLICSVVAKITAEGPKWQGDSSVAQDKMGKERNGAVKRSDSLILVQEGAPHSFYCDASTPLPADLRCAEFEATPWKQNLPAGDDGETLQQCFTRRCNASDTDFTHRTGFGRGEDEPGTDDRECLPGLYCFTDEKQLKNCTLINRIGQSGDANRRGEFGSHCANNVCVMFGTQIDGFRYNLSDSDLIPTPDTTVQSWMFRIGQNFTGFNTGEISGGGNPILSCGGGLEKDFEDYTRGVGDDEICVFKGIFPNSTEYKIEEPAEGGYSNDGKHYCNSKRGALEYTIANQRDRVLWRTPRLCHHRSSIKYCRAVVDDPILSRAYSKFLTTEWITTENNYGKIAGTDKGVADIIIETKTYWEIFNLSVSNNLQYLTFTLGIHVIILLI